MVYLAMLIRRFRRLGSVRCREAVHAGADHGTTTAEYAIVTMAAVAFGGLLIKVLSSGEVSQIITDLVRRALNV